MASHFRLRAATSDDIAVVNHVVGASYASRAMSAFYSPNLYARALPLLRVVRPELVLSGTYYVAEDPSGSIIGCGGWTPYSPARPRQLASAVIGHMRHFATRPDWMGRGVGRAIVDLCVKDARAAGMAALHCDASLGAVAFYCSTGFTPLKHADILLGPDLNFPVLQMAACLLSRPGTPYATADPESPS
jgi:predicted N-acetyltransferase YhbS